MRKALMESFHCVFFPPSIFTMIVYRRSRQNRQPSLCFVCADWRTRSLQILLYQPFNLGLFTHGLNISPLHSGHLPIKKCGSGVVEVIDRGVKPSGDISLEVKLVVEFSPQRSSSPHQPARCHDKARCPEVICVKKKKKG